MRSSFLLATLLVPVLSATLTAQRPIKVFISVDMEGITGVVSNEQLGPDGFEYQRFREFMTAEALAAIEGAREAGATQFVIADSHGNMQNLLIDRFPTDVTIIRGGNRPLGMMHGIDSTFSAAMFIGYHSSTTNVQGVRAHTMSSATFAGVYLNGRSIAESSINAALAGDAGVPVVMVSGRRGNRRGEAQHRLPLGGDHDTSGGAGADPQQGARGDRATAGFPAAPRRGAVHAGHRVQELHAGCGDGTAPGDRAARRAHDPLRCHAAAGRVALSRLFHRVPIRPDALAAPRREPQVLRVTAHCLTGVLP
jgi:hypothetical protein